jgi:Ca-activated chloride channel family protein
MIFANPQAWVLLWLLPLIAIALHLFYEYRCRVMSRFVQKHLIDELAQGFSLKLYRMKAICLMAAFVLMVTAICRPQWGFTIQPVKRHGLDIMVVIDVSKSMLTQDVRPSRLERTKLAVKDLVMKLNGSDHIGLVAFAGDAMVMCPLTYDYNGFLLSLDDLNTDSIPRPGTNMSQAIDESIKAYQGRPESDKAVILVTDGEDQEGNALDAARRAKAQGVRIFTVGVGTQEGDLIQVTNADGQTEFLKDADGNVVKSRLNENLLQQIAYITAGAYVHSGGTQFGLDYLYDHQLSKLKKHDAEEKMSRIYDERFQWPLTLAFGFLLAEAVFLNRWKRYA